MSKVTLVTGLWDIGRENLAQFKRPFETYKERFRELLQLDLDFVVFVPSEMEREVLVQRGHNKSTNIIVKDLDSFKTWFPFYDRVQEIRTSSAWLTGQPHWLPHSPQAALPDYNPIIMSKMFMLNDAVLHDSGQSDYYFWIDGGITTTAALGFLENLKHIDKFMEDKQDKFLFLTYPYTADDEVHGFSRKGLEKYCKGPTVRIPRGGFFGGHKDVIRDVNGWYYDYLGKSLSDGLMGTEESVFCILDANYGPKIYAYELEDNGLVYPFFEHLKQYEEEEPFQLQRKQHKSFGQLRTALFILTYNSPKQVDWLLHSFEVCDQNFLNKPDLYLIDNSTDTTTHSAYDSLCQKYNMTHIKRDNIGICGGRQLAAEIAEEGEYDYHIFFEDDMFLFPPAKAFCPAGFEVYTDNLFERSLEIAHNEQLDFLKLSYSEFYGSNKTQWAWYNISKAWREVYFPDKPNLPKEGIDPDAPLTVEYNRKTYGNLPYFIGEYYYCNWPLWISKEGNRKIFINDKPKHLFEQVWMAEVFYKMRNNQIKAAVLGLSPINHNRFDFYPASQRKES